MNIYLAVEASNHMMERRANEIVLSLLRDNLAAQDVAVVDIAAYADLAIMIASRLHGTGFEAYHQVTPDWDCYMASYRLACQMQTQVQRYQLVYKRSAKPGVVGCVRPRTPERTIQWLHEMTIPAVVCEYYLNGELNPENLKTQAKAYAKAIVGAVDLLPPVARRAKKGASVCMQ